MYLKTPKRYLRGQRRSPISLRWLWLWLLTPLVVFVGYQLYENRDQYRPVVEQAINNVIDGAQAGIATIVAPTALPTQDPTLLITRAEDNWRQGRIESALADYQEAQGGAPNNVLVFYRAALGQLMEGQLTQGLQTAEDAVTADPFSADAWAIRALALNWNERYGEAAASALRALELDPNSARAMAFLAEAYWNLDRGELARETAERALALDENSYEAYRIRGWIRWTVDFDQAAARADFQRAYELAPNLPEQVRDLAVIISNEEQTASDNPTDTAISMLADAAELNPENARILFWLGNLYFRNLGNREQAADYLSRCVEANDQNRECFGLLGRVQLALENYTSAVQNLRRAVELGSQNPRHFLWLGRSYIALGNCPSAVPIMREGYELAQTIGDSEAVTAMAENLAQCQSPVVTAPLVEATAEATAEATPES